MLTNGSRLLRDDVPRYPADLIFKVGKGEDQVEFKAHGFLVCGESGYVQQVVYGQGKVSP